MLRRFLAVLAGAQLAAAIPSDAAAQTLQAQPDLADGWTPRPTKGVSIETAVREDILRRQENSYIGPDTCGFETGNYNSPVLANQNTCYFNTDNSRVGIYETFWQTCWDNSIAQTQRCPISQCTSLTLLCPSQFPYCYQALYANGFIEWRCNLYSQRTVRVDLTYNGQPQQRPIYYTGGSGLSTGSTGPPSSTPISTSSSQSPTPTLIVKPPRKSGTPIGAIVGGVVGGVAVIALFVIGFLYLRYKKRATDAAAKAEQRAMAEQSTINQTSGYPSEVDMLQKKASTGAYYEPRRESYQSASTLVPSYGNQSVSPVTYSSTPNPRESFQTVSAVSGSFPRRASLQTVSSVSDGPYNPRESFQTISSVAGSTQHHSFHGYPYTVQPVFSSTTPATPMGEPLPIGPPTVYELPDENEQHESHHPHDQQDQSHQSFPPVQQDRDEAPHPNNSP